jgi:hypothetical protein
MYAVIIETPGRTLADYRKVAGAIGSEPVKGRVSQFAGERDGALLVTSLWDSKADADAFRSDRLAPAFVQVFGQPTPPRQMIEFEVGELTTD